MIRALAPFSVLAGLALPPAVMGEPATVLYEDRAVEVETTLADPTDLWVTPSDMTAVNRFELKPEGLCLDELCIPVDQSGDGELVVDRQGERWISLTALARHLDQAYVADFEHRVFSFGSIPVTRSGFLDAALAPDFALPDREGKLVRLSDFRGKKVMLLTWASW